MGSSMYNVESAAPILPKRDSKWLLSNLIIHSAIYLKRSDYKTTREHFVMAMKLQIKSCLAKLNLRHTHYSSLAFRAATLHSPPLCPFEFHTNAPRENRPNKRIIFGMSNYLSAHYGIYALHHASSFPPPATATPPVQPSPSTRSTFRNQHGSICHLPHQIGEREG
eukprot:scaffold12928_cov64-Cyclotella_meneghiniana.AAC.2